MLKNVTYDFNKSYIYISYIEPIQYKSEDTYKLYSTDTRQCIFPSGYTGIKYITEYDKLFQIENGLDLLPECKDKIALIVLNSKETVSTFKELSAIEYNKLIK